MGRPLAAQAFCLRKNLGAGGIHFRRACEKTREATEGRGFLPRPSVGGSCSTCSARPAGRTRRTTSCYWDKAVSCSTGPHRRWGGACAVQAFCLRQNLGAGGIHFRRACEKTREATEGRGFLSRPSVGGSCSTCSAKPAGRTRRTTSCCWGNPGGLRPDSPGK